VVTNASGTDNDRARGAVEGGYDDGRSRFRQPIALPIGLPPATAWRFRSKAARRGTTMLAMATTRDDDQLGPEVADPDWFRAPSRREHWIAAALFVGFGMFFCLLFVVNRGWWFAWVILLLGMWSLVYGARHALDARRANVEGKR
jgi:hypothetical protein